MLVYKGLVLYMEISSLEILLNSRYDVVVVYNKEEVSLLKMTFLVCR